MQLVSILLVSVPLLVSAVVGISLIAFIRLRERNYPRHSPLTRKLMRPPGYSLRIKIQNINEELLSAILAIFFIPITIYAVHVTQTAYGGVPESAFRWVVSVASALCFAAYLAWRLAQAFQERKWLTLGLDGEMFVGEELNQLMLLGCRVFHDVPYDHGNIDHVVISESGVHSVNTKMVGKPKSGGAKVVVDHDKGVVEFPDRIWNLPTPQLEGEAKWLGRYLSESTGQQIDAEAILALPGWYVSKRIGRGSVYVINPFEPEKFFVRSKRVLSAAQIDQIAFQLDRLCRDLDPVYRAKVKWDAK